MSAKQFVLVAVAIVGGVFSAGSFAADVPGAKDPAFLQRYAGSEIVEYITKPYVQYSLGLDVEFAKKLEIEGQLTRLIYRVPDGHTVLELLRNYEQSLEASGFHRLYEHPFSGNNCSNATVDACYGANAFSQPFQPQPSGDPPFDETVQDFGAVIEKGIVGGHDTTVVVVLADYSRAIEVTFPGSTKPMQFAPGRLAVLVDVITSAQIKQNMVTVKATDMADALATKGFIDLYGIYFDTDKADVKLESMSTLDEVATLLKIDRSLKLEVSGHTDNSGSKDHNLKLSQARANAVVAVLVSKYNIDPKRLIAKGYGDTKPVAPNTTEDGKAKNRRVELRKI